MFRSKNIFFLHFVFIINFEISEIRYRETKSGALFQVILKRQEKKVFLWNIDKKLVQFSFEMCSKKKEKKQETTEK